MSMDLTQAYSPASSIGEYDLEDPFIASESDVEVSAHPDSSSESSCDGSDAPLVAVGRKLARWHLTWHGFAGAGDEDFAIDAFRGLLEQYCKHWCFQVEQAAAGGARHLQVRLSLKVRARWSRVRALFPGCFVTIESTRAGDTGLGSLYAMKADTRVAGPWSNRDVVRYRDPQYDIGEHYRPWQAEVVRLLGIQTSRQILIVVDPAGNSGKTVLAHHLVLFKGGIFVPAFCQTGDDVLAFVHGQARSGEATTIVIDVPRASLLSRIAPRLFAAFETIKAGYLYDRRYHAQVTYIPPPRIVVFCNTEPDRTLLTGDRWVTLRLPWRGGLPAASLISYAQGYPGLVPSGLSTTHHHDDDGVQAAVDPFGVEY